MAPTGNKGKRKQRPSRKGTNIGESNTTDVQTGLHSSRTGLRELDLGAPLELQQLLLDVFQNTFSTQFNDSLSKKVQEVKQHLFNRDFTHAFGDQAFLDAYAMRWSPSRALAYFDIFKNLFENHMQLLSYLRRLHPDLSDKSEQIDISVIPSPQALPSLLQQEGTITHIKVLSLGGGSGAEVVALAGLLCDIGRSAKSIGSTGGDLRQPKMIVEVTAVDIADWSSIISRLNTSLTTMLAIPGHALGEVPNDIASNFDQDSFRVKFGQHDLLKMEVSQMKTLLENCTLVTFMFTLNELYSISLSETTKCLLSITDLIQQGSLLLVVDSPGSYSTVNIGRDAKSHATEKQKEPSAQRNYPMLWLLDRTLLHTAVDGTGKLSNQGKQWEKLRGNDSTWFRLPPGLKYPIEIENMRYQIHMYRRL
ncbi:MAG: hypothetical protein Q9195_001036 [Heterodermia aff. obscurata]